jgi:hypothetical protein
MVKPSVPTPAAIDRVIRQHLARLNKPGVLTLRPGFEIAGHRLTGKAAIVATVFAKRRDLPPSQRLPASLGGVPVDVREATAHQRLRASDAAAAALMQVYGRPEERAPIWPLEREMPGGRLLTSPHSETRKTLDAFAAGHPAITRATAAAAHKPQIPYVPAANAPLTPLTITATVTASVSPDAGFAVLTAFLADTKQSLVVGMYDFTSGPILALFENDLGAPRTLQMVLDNPALDPTSDQTDTQTVTELNAALGNRSSIARALTQQDIYASAWMFPGAYHIKVMVRDGAAVWLSSGNLDNSNQPDSASPPTHEDRDWHVIVEDPALAALFTAYLDQDFTSAAAHQQAADTAVAEAVGRAAAKLAAERTPLPGGSGGPAEAVVPARTFANVAVTLSPLLTPDTLATDSSQGQYISAMVNLIDGAQKSLYVQLQYIEASTDAAYSQLLQAIARRVAAGVDVRLIESQEYGEPWAEKMKSTGVDLTANIALQPNVHNKGFVVDSRVVVVSSQNFSPEGVRTNRDAGLIIDNAAIAQYYEAVFLSDWATKATSFAPPAARKRAATRAKGVSSRSRRSRR